MSETEWREQSSTMTLKQILLQSRKAYMPEPSMRSRSRGPLRSAMVFVIRSTAMLMLFTALAPGVSAIEVPLPSPSTIERLQFDGIKPGYGDDSEGSDPDFAWRSSWREQPEWGDRIGYVDSTGTLRVRTRRVDTASWVVVARNVKDFQLLDWRIAVLKQNGVLLLAEGPLNTPLKVIDQGVAAFQLTLTRVGILRTDGTFLIKEWGFLPQKVATRIQAFQVLADRIGVLDLDGKLWVHPRGTVTRFLPIAEGVDTFQLEREWIGILKGGRLLIGKGELIQEGKMLSFVDQATNVTDFEMEVTVDLAAIPKSRLHLAVVDGAGNLGIGEGEKPAIPLQSIKANASKVHWAGRQLAITTLDGGLQIGKLQDSSGTLSDVKLVGQTTAFRLNPEGTLLLSRKGGQLSAVGTRPNPPLFPTTDAAQNVTPLPPFLPILPAPSGVVLGSEQTLVDQAGLSPVIRAFEVSSIRPTFTRRSIKMTGRGFVQ